MFVSLGIIRKNLDLLLVIDFLSHYYSGSNAPCKQQALELLRYRLILTIQGREGA
jgi:hypothetical protein